MYLSENIKHAGTNKRLFKAIGICMLYCLISVASDGQKLKSDVQSQINFSDLSPNKASVIVFFDIECPICQKYTRQLKDISQKYASEQVKVYVVYPHKNPDVKVFQDFKKEYQFDLPIYFDKRKELLNKLNGSVTPEAFLLDKFGRTVYHGAIDNWFYDLGKSRAQATESYLTDAIENLIKGETIKKSYQEPIGCAL